MTPSNIAPTPNSEAITAIVPATLPQKNLTETLLEAQRQSLEMLVRGARVGEVLMQLTRVVEELAEGQAVASILLLDDCGRLRNGASPSLPAWYLQAIDGLAPNKDVGTCASAAATGECVVTLDFETDPKWSELKQLPLSLGFKGAWSKPILASDGSVLGTFGTYFRECREPSVLEMQVVEVLARTAALAIERGKFEEVLRSSEERFRKLFEHAPTGIAISSLDGKMEVANPAYCALVGYTMEELRGAPTRNLVHPDDQEENFAGLPDLLSGRIERIEVENRYIKKSGETVWVHKLASVLRDQDGAPTQLLGLVTDITERKLIELESKTLHEILEQKVLERTAELEASNREMEGFTYSVSHDLRSPLRAIASTSRILVEDHVDKLTADGIELLESQATAATRMGTLIDDLLTLSRLGRKELMRQDVDMTSLTRRIISLVATEHGSEYQANVEDGMMASGDQHLLDLLLLNLIGNAFKFARADVPFEISVGATEENGLSVFHVKDNGIGFDMKYSHKLFLPFERLVLDSDYPGTGIGLANVKRIVERHGGRVWAESKLDEGATFYFTLGRLGSLKRNTLGALV